MANRANQTPPQQDRSLPVRLLQVREAVMSITRPALRRHRFTEQQWRVLRKLDRDVPMDKTALARAAVLLPPSLTRILRGLKASGLIRTVPAANNRRIAHIALTPKGEAAVKRCAADIMAKNKIIRGRTGDAAFEHLLDALDRFEERLGKS